MRHSASTWKADFALTGRPLRVGNNGSLAALYDANEGAPMDGREKRARGSRAARSNPSIPKTLTIAANLAHNLMQLTVRSFG